MGPIRGQTRPMPLKAGIVPEAQHIDAKLNASIHNRFDVEVVDAATGKIKQRAQAENVICNQLWTRMLSPEAYFNYIHYGTGSGTPAVGDTSLFNFAGYGTPALAGDVVTNTPAAGVYSLRRKIVLSETIAVGTTITEVGIAYSTTATTLCTHAMLKDMSGNTISIAKTATDIINIYATVFVHYAATGYSNGMIRIIPKGVPAMYINILEGSQYNGFLPYLCGMYSNSYADVPTLFDCGVGFSCSVDVGSINLTRTINSSAKTITLAGTRLGASIANIGGIMAFTIGAGRTFPGVPPTILIKPGADGFAMSSVTAEAIGTGDGATTDFATAFPYWSDGTVFVDGVAQSNVVFTQEPISYNDVGKYFYSIDADSTEGNLIPYFDSTPRNDDGYMITGTHIYYNPYYSAGVSSFNSSPVTVLCSNDLVNWTGITGTSVPKEYQHFKYWKCINSGSSSQKWNGLIAAAGHTGKSIHFSTAPASGAVITGNYTTNSIAKDANHVFDLTVTIQLGEHTA